MRIMATDLILPANAEIGYDPYNSVDSYDDAVAWLHCSCDEEYFELMHEVNIVKALEGDRVVK